MSSAGDGKSDVIDQVMKSEKVKVGGGVVLVRERQRSQGRGQEARMRVRMSQEGPRKEAASNRRWAVTGSRASQERERVRVIRCQHVWYVRLHDLTVYTGFLKH